MKFIIIGNPRAGTTTLFNAFKSIGLKGLNEPFNKKSNNWIKDYDELKINRRAGPREFYQCLDLISNKYEYIKHLLYEIKPSKNELLAKAYRTIFIYRKNIFESALSNQISKETQVWNSSQINESYLNQEINICEKRLYKSIKYYQSKNRYMIDLYNKNQKKSILINYEDLYYKDTEKCLSKIEGLTNLRLNNEDFNVLKKMNKVESYNRVSNLKDIKEKYKEYGVIEHE
jgi:LPS sulfotransferase NodH